MKLLKLIVLLLGVNVFFINCNTGQSTSSTSKIQTLTLQPAKNNTNEINFAGPGVGFSAHDIDLDAGAWTIGGNGIYQRGAFNFDLSGIPASSTILSAKLSLYSNPVPINGDQHSANAGYDNSFFIRRITSTWDGNTATWQTQPSTTAINQLSFPHTERSFLDLVDIDVKLLIDDMRTNGGFGFMMMLQNETPFNIRQFCSSNHPDASKHPKLVLTYQ